MVAPEVTVAVVAFGGGIGGGGGGGGNDGPGDKVPGDNESIGESSSVKRSRMLSSSDGSLLSVVPRSFENPEATSSSCWTGCRGNSGKKSLLSAPFEAEVEVEVELEFEAMTKV